MNFHLRCRCGPRRQIRANLVDATPRPVPRYDPTGTVPISKQFGKDFAQRWQRVRRMIPDAVSLKLNNAATHALITGNDPVRAFQAWLDESMRQFVLGINGTWTMPYVRGAGDLARATSAQTLGDAFNPDQPNVDRVPLLQSLTISELRGIIDATSQQATRAFANGILANLSSSRTARNVNAVIDSIGRRRSQLLASFMPMRSFSAVTLDAFRAHGVASVGTIAERARVVSSAPSPTILARDAKKKTYKPKNLVEVLTAGDSKVCEDCEQISDEGPYSIDEAENLIPAHINCRCLFVPWHDERFADPEDVGDGDLPGHEFHGNQWTTGGGGSAADFSDLAKQTMQQPLSPEATDVMSRYSGFSTIALNRTLNNYLRSDRASDYQPDWWAVGATDEDRQQWNDNITTLDKAIAGTSLPHDLPVYRGIKADLLAHLKPGDTFTDKGYMSTTTERSHADIFGDQVMAFTLPKGAKALPVTSDIGGGTLEGAPENEVILPRGSQFRYLGKDSSGVHNFDLLKKTIKDAFNEANHPREPAGSSEGGQFTSGGGGGGITPSAQPVGGGSIAEKHAAMQKEIDEKDLHMKFEGSLGGTEGPVFFTEKQHEAAMHAMAAKHGMKLTKIIEGESVSTWKPEHALSPAAPAIKQGPEQIDVATLTKTGGKKGSNEGGVYTSGKYFDEPGSTQYYIKNPPTKDHVQNETMAAKLYQLAGARTMDYVPVKGGEHVATILKPLDKDNISKFSTAEKAEAQKDFGIHAWLSNWDAAGTGGDNQVVIGGHTHTVDVGGSMKYRAQGTAKGSDYGSKVTETLSMLDPNKSPDAAKLYGSMTTFDKIESYKRVTAIPDAAIYKTVSEAGGSAEDAHLLIDRKNDLGKQTAALEKTLGITPLMAAPEPAPPVSGVTEHNIAMLAATAKAAQAVHEAQVISAAPVPVFKTKMEHVAHLLNKGTTNEEIKGKLNWPTISVPQVAHNLNMKLEKVKVDGVIHYKATPMTPEQIAAKGAKPAKATAPTQATPEQAAFFKAAMKGEATPVPVVTKPEPSTAEYNKIFEELATPAEPLKPAAETTVGNFLNELDDLNIDYEHIEGANYHHITPKQHFAAFVSGIAAKDHPDVVNNGDGSFSIAKPGAPKPAPLAATKTILNAPAAPTPTPAPTKHDISTPEGNFKQSLDDLGIKYTAIEGKFSHHVTPDEKDWATVKDVAKYHPQVTEMGGTFSVTKASTVVPTPAPAPTLPQAAPPPPPPPEPPTADELKKAQKNTALTAQYVPGAPAGHPEAEKLIAAFNQKYEGKVITDPQALAQKVAEFKQLSANMVPFQSEKQAQEAKVKAQQLVTQAENAAKAQQLATQVAAAEKAAHEAEMNDPETKAHYEALKGVGINQNEMKAAEYTIKKHNLAITPKQGAAIQAYVGNHYIKVNDTLRMGKKMSLDQVRFAQVLDSALEKMPIYAGYTQRGIKNDPGFKIFQNYADNVGSVITENQFTSAGVNHKLWGPTTIHIQGKNGRDIRAFNSGEGGGEIVYRKGTHLHIIKVNANTHEVWAEEV